MELIAANKSQIRAVFSNANYVRLLFAQIIGALGDRIHQMALLSFIIFISHSTNTTKHIADITFWGILPAAIFGPYAMTLVDRWPWKRIMLLSILFRSVLAIAMPTILLTWPNIHTAWITAFLLGTFAAVFAPCRLAIMPNIVARSQLVTTNAISSQVGNIATILGVPFGGYLVDVIGRNAGFYVDGVAFFAAACLILLLRPSAPSTHHASARPQSNLVEEIRAGLLYLRGHTDVRLTILFFGFLTMVSSFLYVCLFSYSIEVLGLKERGMGQLLGILGLGMAAGAGLLVWKPGIGEHARIPFVGLAGAGLLIWRMSLGGSSHFVAALLFGVGFCGILSLVPNDTYLQHHVPEKVRGRVFVVRGFFGSLIWLFSLQLVKSAVHHMGLVWVLAWLGVGSVIMAALFGLLPAPRPAPVRATRGEVLTPS
jgi:MFS family permease